MFLASTYNSKIESFNLDQDDDEDEQGDGTSNFSFFNDLNDDCESFLQILPKNIEIVKPTRSVPNDVNSKDAQSSLVSNGANVIGDLYNTFFITHSIHLQIRHLFNF